MNRTYRRLTVWISIIAVLFAQLALSAYACPMEQIATSVATNIQLDADCCADGAGSTSSLCHEHCKDSKVVGVDAPPLPPGFIASFIVTLPLEQDSVPSANAQSTSAIERPSPPNSILYCCFRI